MKYRIIFLLPGLLAFCCGYAQNMVANPSMEDYIVCPVSISEVGTPFDVMPTSIIKWYTANAGTSDYMNTCAVESLGVCIPHNVLGYQPARTGNGYLGFYAKGTSELGEYREYLETELIAPLPAGHRIYAGFWVSLADGTGISGVEAVDRIGIYFNADTVFSFYPVMVIDVTPQIDNPKGHILSDTVQWQLVDGSFIAAGGEKWATFGNFYHDADITSDTLVYIDDPFPQVFAYYYMDDACVLDFDGEAGEFATHSTTICGGKEVVLTMPDTFRNCLWDNNMTAQTRSVNAPGTYWVKSVNAYTCAIRIDTFTVIHQSEEQLVNLGSDTAICRDIPLVLDAFSNSFDNYYWNTGDREAELTINTAGTYSVTASSDCFYGSDTINISLVPLPEARLPGDTILCAGIPLNLGAGTPGTTYSWNTGADTCCIIAEHSGTYTLVAGNTCHETATDSIVIIFSGCNNCIMAPNAFTPNNDGINDRFGLQINCTLKTYRLSIFNRWGQLVYSSVRPDDQWDGMYSGTPADAGTYFYYLDALPAIDEIGNLNKKGDLTLIR